MAVTHKFYGNAFVSTFNKLADWDSDTVKTMLASVGYVPNQDTDDFKNDVTNEVTGTGYSAGGATISPLTAAYDGPSNVYSLDGADAAWSSATISGIRIAVNYDATPGTDATRPLLTYVDMGADQSVSSATFTIIWAAGGICSVTVA